MDGFKSFSKFRKGTSAALAAMKVSHKAPYSSTLVRHPKWKCNLAPPSHLTLVTVMQCCLSKEPCATILLTTNAKNNHSHPCEHSCGLCARTSSQRLAVCFTSV